MLYILHFFPHFLYLVGLRKRNMNFARSVTNSMVGGEMIEEKNSTNLHIHTQTQHRIANSSAIHSYFEATKIRYCVHSLHRFIFGRSHDCAGVRCIRVVIMRLGWTPTLL